MKLNFKKFLPKINTKPKSGIGIPKVRINKGLGGLVPHIKK